MKQIPNNVLFPYGKQRIEQSKGLKRWIYYLLPYHIAVLLRQELHLIWIRFTYYFFGPRFKNQHDLLVNLGCGGSGQAGWINVDVYRGAKIDLVYDIRKKIPLPDNSAKGIFCEHFFEHLDYSEEVPFFLSECHRILQKNGVLRIIVPDAEKYLSAYCQGGWDGLSRIRPLQEGYKDYWYGNHFETRMELINLVFRQGVEHKFAYDWETLEHVLLKFGFNQVTRRQYGESALAELCIDKEARASESVYVEGTK